MIVLSASGVVADCFYSDCPLDTSMMPDRWSPLHVSIMAQSEACWVCDSLVTKSGDLECACDVGTEYVYALLGTATIVGASYQEASETWLTPAMNIKMLDRPIIIDSNDRVWVVEMMDSI